MDTFDLVEILVNNSSFSRGKLVSLLKKYPLNKFTTEKLLVEILNEKSGKSFSNPEDFVIYLFNESKNRKLTLAQNNKKREIMKQKEEDRKRKRELTSARKLQKTFEAINSRESCNSCGAIVNVNGLCRC